MSGFQATLTSGVTVCRGDPSCDAAHASLLAALKKLGTPFVNPHDTITVNQQGNLGEFISFHIARFGPLAATAKFAQNALQPLSGISGAGIDLTYVYFDKTTPANDRLYIQEIKTTCADNLEYLNRLTADYKKLFSANVNFTLQTRIQNLANIFEIERDSEEYADRVQRLAGVSPTECARIRLIPTGVHRLGVGNPVEKLLAIQSSIVSFGWSSTAIAPWSIGLGDLEDRLLRLARGQL